VVAARSQLDKDHLSVAVVSHLWSSELNKGRVISQYPVPGTRLHAKQVVGVTLSLGPEPVAVPPLATLTLSQARSELLAAQLRLGKVSSRSSLTVPKGIVISWSDKGSRLLPGSVVNVVVSTGLPVVVVPSGAVGMTYTELRSELLDLRLAVHEVEYWNNSVPVGGVLATGPAPGASVVIGTVVTVDVSAGPHLVTIPSAVVGMSLGQAEALLKREGLGVDAVEGDPQAAVTGTMPAIGTQVLFGRSITLVTN
jgi:serine/threonine-protein kinase